MTRKELYYDVKYEKILGKKRHQQLPKEIPLNGVQSGTKGRKEEGVELRYPELAPSKTRNGYKFSGIQKIRTYKETNRNVT